MEIEDTYAEAFSLSYTSVLITAINKNWAYNAARSVTGFATSIIGCDVEAGVDIEVSKDKTPDNREGVVVQFWAPKKTLEKSCLFRLAQCVLTSPTASVWNYLDSEEKIDVGHKLRFFGDGYEQEAAMYGRDVIKVPIMGGEFIVEKSFGIKEGVAGGNLLIIGKSLECTLEAAEAAIKNISDVEGAVTCFPGGLCASGSKVGSKYSFLRASTNDKFCPTLKDKVDSNLSEDANCVLEIVINGTTIETLKKAMKVAIDGISTVDGIIKVTAANYGGKLGKYKINLKDL